MTPPSRLALRRLQVLVLALATGCSALAFADAAAPKDGVIFGPGVQQGFKANSGQITTDLSNGGLITSLEVKVKPGKDGYPGVDFTPVGGTEWDLSKYGHIDAVFTNTGTATQGFCLRIDNGGDWKTNPWDAENVWLKPGTKGTVRVIFGRSFGHPGYKLDPSKVVRIMVFTESPKSDQSYRLDSIIAGGSPGEQPPVNPADVRTVPVNGAMFGAGTPAKEKQFKATGGAKATVDGAALQLDFPAKSKSAVLFSAPAGKWDLRQDLQITVKLKNTGSAPVTPRLRAENTEWSGTDWAGGDSALAPGAERDIVIPFRAAKMWTGAKDNDGNTFTNDNMSGLRFTIDSTDAPAQLTVESVTAGRPELHLPDWLGKRPPVPGDWTQTLDENFNGSTIDTARWNEVAPNYWDTRTHFTKEETSVADGVATLKYEKKTGSQGDDPKEKQTDYAAGYLDTYGKWVQRYGYFETRIKLPSAPGLWPAFWLMPDRGVAAGPQWKRADTENGGMEFDICEHLDRWGPCRYNIAMHWDGYGKDHKSTGSAINYVQPDKDGYIVVGLLWTPGEASYYANGQEILHWANPRISDVPSNIIFNMVSGGWDNDELQDSKLPADFKIDYVRVWQRKDLASAADGPQKAAAAPAAPAK